MDKEYPIEFPITQEHYERASAERERNSRTYAISHCLVAEALRDYFPDATYVSVGFLSAAIGDQHYELSLETSKVIQAFVDKNPITFPVTGAMKGVIY